MAQSCCVTLKLQNAETADGQSIGCGQPLSVVAVGARAGKDKRSNLFHNLFRRTAQLSPFNCQM